jgi:flagellar biogenesis protein FliO
VNLKQVQASGTRVDLLFDGKISRAQIKTEFFNDIIQLSMTDAAVYPAKISSITGGDLTKVFAYQYAPKLVRCRLSVKGKAEDFKSRLIIDQKGNMLTIRFDETTDSIASHSAQAVRPQKKAKAADADNDDNDPGEKALLERILNNVKPAEAQKAAEQKADAKADAKAEAKTEAPRAPAQAEPKREAAAMQGPQPLATGKPLLSPVTMVIKMFAVLALFGLCAIGLKKLLNAGGTRKGGALSRFLQKSMSRYGKAGKMIEVVSTHHLGPKKSIAVVKVAGRNLVLGISQDSINLITQLDGAEAFDGGGAPEAELDDIDLAALGVRGAQAYTGTTAPAGSRAGATAPAGASAFDNVLSEEATRPQLEPNGARARIRSRLEGMKPL